MFHELDTPNALLANLADRIPLSNPSIYGLKVMKPDGSGK